MNVTESKIRYHRCNCTYKAGLYQPSSANPLPIRWQAMCYKSSFAPLYPAKIDLRHRSRLTIHPSPLTTLKPMTGDK
jgi:hypothetical protein